MNIPKNIKAVIFDLDGLLINSEPFWQKTDKEFFATYNKKFSKSINNQILGMGHKEIMEFFISKYHFPNNSKKLIDQRKNLLYKYLFKKLTLMQGAKKIINRLFVRKYKLAVATSGHSKNKTKEILDKLDIITYFIVWESGDNVIKSKPHPEIYLKTARLIKVNPNDCLVLEDAPNGVLAGKAAGMCVFGVNSDQYFQKELKRAGADEVFASLSEIEV